MARLPRPPTVAALAAGAPVWRDLQEGTLLFRVCFRGGQHPTGWNTFRAYGPTGARFDHHTDPQREQERRVCHAGLSIQTCLAEVFQQAGVIDVAADEPTLVAFRTATRLHLLDLSGHWPTRAGASMVINSGSHARARLWSRSIYDAYPDAQGVWYCSSMDANNPCVALYERGEAALPASLELHLPLADPRLRAALIRCATTLSYRLVW